MKYLLLFSFLLCICVTTVSQEKANRLKPVKIGALYNFGTNENFIFDDPDYTYTKHTIKAQFFYELVRWKKLNFELIVQPQIQFLQHQLLNPFYVTPDQDNFREKIAEFTQPKNMNLYGIEFGFVTKRTLLKKLDIQGGISLGFNYINTRTERLAKGFTFNENFSLGFSYNILKSTFLYVGTNFGHVSNLDFQRPNDGYNILGIEVGISYALK